MWLHIHPKKSNPEKAGIQLLHLFEPVLISGEAGNRMDQKYVRPLIQNSSIEMIPLSPEEPAQAELQKKIRQAFTLSEKDWGYEFKLPSAVDRYLDGIAGNCPSILLWSQNTQEKLRIKK